MTYSLWLDEEVIKAGEKALEESEGKQFTQREKVLQVFLAMYGVQQIIEARHGVIH